MHDRWMVPLSLLVLSLGACTNQAPAPLPPPAPPPRATPAMPDAGAATYDGQLSYPLRIALPPDTEALVEVLDSRSERVIATARFALDGRQVPVPFTIDVPPAAIDDARILRAAFIVNGRKRWRSETVPLSPARLHLGSLTLGPIAPSVARYRCGEILVGIAPTEDGRADLELPSRRFVLLAAPSASGARYVSSQDPRTWFWSEGAKASLSIEGERLPPCAVVGTSGAQP